MRSILTILVITALAGNLLAQQAQSLQFEESIHDFGIIKEEDGAAEYEFKFINNSTEPVKILGVKASCGCTTPAWSKEPIQPGESGYIKARYNTKNRPGPFNKSLTVTTDLKDQGVTRLYIKGQVTPKPKTIEEGMPELMGGLRFKYNSFNLGKVYTRDKPTTKEFEVYNSSDSSITFSEQIEGPAYIAVTFEPLILAPRQKGNIKVSYSAKDRNDLGFVTDNIVIVTDEEGDNARKSFTVYATIQEYFPPMTAEELAKAPKLVISEPVVDFGKIKQGEKTKATYTLTNEGKSNLNIRMTKSTCSCTVAKLSKDNIKPGKSVELVLTFDSTERRGNQQKSISVFSNDPKRPVQRVTIKGSIELQ